MSNIILKNLKVVVAQPKRRYSSSEYVKQGKLIEGTVIEVDGVYKVSIDLDGNGTSEELILDFTPRSFEIVGRKTVFTRTKDEYGHTCRIIRDENKAKFHPGSIEQYVPFSKNWIVKGYIVKEGFIKLFDFKTLVGINGYIVKE